MTEKLRFHLDEHVHPGVAAVLRQLGIDVTTTLEADLRGADDQSHLAFAWRERRVIVTHDDDFLRWHSRSTPHAGLAYCHPNKRTVAQIVEILLLMHETLSPDKMLGQVQFL